MRGYGTYKHNIFLCSENSPNLTCCIILNAGLLSLGVPGVPWDTQILGDQLTLFQPGGTNYAHLITIGTPGFSDLPMALNSGLMPNLIKKSWTDSTIGVLFLYIFEVTVVKNSLQFAIFCCM